METRDVSSQPPSPLPADQQPAPRASTGLSFGDGFQFGCGFFAAGLLATLILLVILALVGLVLSVVGANVVQNLLGG